MTVARSSPEADAVSSGDNRLMARMQAGSLDAFGELYARYCERAYRVARSVSVDDAHAQDAVQEAFVSIWNTRASYTPQRSTPAPWLLTVVRHRAIDMTRRDAREAARRVGIRPLEDCCSGDDVAAETADRAQARDLRVLLGRLPDPQRDVIVLAFYAELTHIEIAEHLGLPMGTVKGRMRLGLHKLRGELETAVP